MGRSLLPSSGMGFTAATSLIRIFTVLLATGLLSDTGCAFAEDQDTALFAPFARVLDMHVQEYPLTGGGLVSSFDYRAAQADIETMRLIDQQRVRLAEFDPERIESRQQALAFWINAYNFFMIAHILEHPGDGKPVDSVRDYGSLFNPYRVFDRNLFDIGGRHYALSEIEIDVLLGEEFAARGWKDARVHFAVNCASVGCPPLREKAYNAETVDGMLDENTRLALNTPLHLHIEEDTLWLSSLFDWYQSDFAEQSGSVREFIGEHVNKSTRQRIKQATQTRFIDYDWDLNGPDNIRAWIEARNLEQPDP